MTKFSVIKFILKQRVSNILLLSVMFSSLIVVLMVGIGIKNLFYDYLKSDYGNIPDIKLVLNDLSDEKTDKLIDEIKKEFLDDDIDILTGYEDNFKVSITDSDDLLLTNGLDLFIKGIRFDNRLTLMIDNKKVSLDVQKISYQDELYLKLALNGLKISNINNIKFIAKNKEVNIGFCHKFLVKDDSLILMAQKCKDRADRLLEKLQEDKAKQLKIEVDGKVFSTKIIYVDNYYKSLVVEPKGIKEAKRVSLAYKDIEIDNSFVQSVEMVDGEFVINFYQDNTMEKKFKLFLSEILKDFINYKRMILKVKIYSFENDDIDDKEDPLLVYLNELTDLIDLIFAKDIGNIAISSSFLAGDLNNFGVLDNFNIKSGDYEYSLSIRGTIEYNPENLYNNKNIVIVNQNFLKENLGIENKNNYIDIYSSSIGFDFDIKKLMAIVDKYDSYYKILKQSDIIPSIKPKKILFDTTITIIAVFILTILFIAMYIVLRQFYSNFNSELSLLKLYGSKIPYQGFINFVSFIISAVINYIFLLQEEKIINDIMVKYFFTQYHISINDYLISIGILFIYVVIFYFLEYKEIKKLNLIKGQ